ncbi:hypothetical protein AAF712_009040 [Marasmius tenuissimus]|uniref:Amino acid transporter n=1 Tax=Marasmius tenuissimus TaxID=585030 RepID=A0ABR2ZRI7_9AGAR
MTVHAEEKIEKEELVRQADEELLASLGYKQEFKRAFSPLEVFGVAFSIQGLLPSIASVLGFAIPNGGGPAMVWGWAVGSIFTLFGALAMAEIASSAPTSGGLYYWTYSLSSTKWRNLLCWIVGYANTTSGIASIASINWACAQQIAAAAYIGSNGTFEATIPQILDLNSFLQSGIYAALLIVHMAVCSLGTSALARLQTVYIVLNVMLCLGIIIALPVATPSEFKNDADFALFKFVNLSGWPDGFAFILSFLAPIWTISKSGIPSPWYPTYSRNSGGLDSSVHLSEEATNAATAIPWSIVSSVTIGGILGTAINVVVAFCMGSDLDTLAQSDQPMVLIFMNAFGMKGTLAVWAVSIVVQFMMGSSSLLATSRQIFAFSRDKALPLSSWLYTINGYTKSPVNTVIFASILTLVLGTLAFASTSAVDAVFSISSTAAYIAFSIPILARVIGNGSFKPGPFTLGIFGPPIAIIAVASMILMGVVFLFPATPTTDITEMNYSVVVLGGVMVLSLGWYYLPVYGGVHWFTGPVTTIEPSTPDGGGELFEKEEGSDK